MSEYSKDYYNGYSYSNFIKCNSDDFKLSMTFEQHQKLCALYNASEKEKCEVLGLGQVEYDRESSKFIMKEFIIPKQEATASSCDIDREDMAKMIMKGIRMNFWVHTHPNMGAFWSVTDDDTSRELCGKADYFVSLVIGSGHKMEARIDILRPFELMISIPVEVDGGDMNKYDEAYEEEFKKKVKQRTFFKSYTKRRWDSKTGKWTDVDDGKDYNGGNGVKEFYNEYDGYFEGDEYDDGKIKWRWDLKNKKWIEVPKTTKKVATNGGKNGSKRVGKRKVVI